MPLSYARGFHALADDTRLQIVEMLLHGRRCVCDLGDCLHMPQPLVSFHLKVLREAGIVTCDRHGRLVYYSLRREAVQRLAGFLRAIAAQRVRETVP